MPTPDELNKMQQKVSSETPLSRRTERQASKLAKSQVDKNYVASSDEDEDGCLEELFGILLLGATGIAALATWVMN